MYYKYLIKRFCVTLLVIFISVTVNFSIPRLLPGDPVNNLFNTLLASSGGQIGDKETMVQEYNKKFGFDAPIWEQYINYWKDVLKLDFGYSLVNYPTRVIDIIMASLPWTLALMITSVLISFFIGSLLGGILAWPSVSRMVKVFIPVFLVLSAIPYFLLGIFLIYFLAIKTQIFPAGQGFQSGMVLKFNLATIGILMKHAILPIISVVVAGIGSWTLGMRGMMISTVTEDYMLYAEQKGLKTIRIFFMYGMRNALLPQLTQLATRLGQVVVGALLVEVVFSYPGIGYKLFMAIQNQDYFVIQGIILFLIFAVAIVLFIMDIIYPLIDPRISNVRE